MTRAEAIYSALPAESRDAFFQLVLYPVQASATVNELYVTVGLNRLYAEQGRTATNATALRARELFLTDERLTRSYNEDLAEGKWRHFMDQTHIGYTYWQQPYRNALPAITEVQVPRAAELGVAIEGSPRAWPGHDPGQGRATLPVMDPWGARERTLEIFNRGRDSFSFSVRASAAWLRVEPMAGEVAEGVRVFVSVDWDRVPAGNQEASLSIEGPSGQSVVVEVPVFRPEAIDAISGFVESDGHISIEAEHFDRAVETRGITWEVLEDHGRTLSSVTPFPVTSKSLEPGGDAPRIEYDVHLFSSGALSVDLYTAPSLSFVPGRGLRCAVSWDDAVPEIVEVHADPSHRDWQRAVRDGVRRSRTQHELAEPGRHVLKVWMVDPGFVLQKIVVDTGGLRPSELGPPESTRVPLP